MADRAVSFLYGASDRHNGVSAPPYTSLNLATHVGDDPAAVQANRARFAASVGTTIAWMDQVHGNEVVVVDGPVTTAFPATDALVTRRPDVGLAVLVADCVPVVLFDPKQGVIAVAHAGRRGVSSGVVARTLDVMRGLGAAVADVRAWLGPAICPRCYEVSADIRAEVDAAAPGAASTTSTGKPAVDLKAALRRQLDGVATIDDVAVCTAESPDHFSNRRDGVTGRFAGYIRMT